MAEDVIQLPPDSTGKKIRAIALVVGANTVYMEGCVPYDEDGVGLWSAAGAGSVALETVFGEGAPINAGNPLFTDLIDRAGRLVGIVYGQSDQLQQTTPADAHANPDDALEVVGFPMVWDPVAGDWNRAREGANIGEALVDVADRAARLIGVVYGENAQLQQLTPADGLTPNESLEVTGFTHVWDSVASDWNRLREGANIGEALVDLADRAGRLVGVVYGDAGQIHQVTPADALAPGDALSVAGFNFVYNDVTWDMVREGSVPGSILTEDSGVHTNPRRYEKDNGFYSAVVARVGGVATALWAIATAPARTAGKVTTIYTLEIENSTGAAVTAWLEIGGVVITVPFHINDNDSVPIEFVGGFNTGNADIDCNASVDDVVFSIKGTEA